MATTTMWNPTTHSDYDALDGMPVYSRDGEKVGTIRGVFHPALDMPAARGKHLFLLDPGLLRDWFGGYDKVYLPESAIAAVGPDGVTLDLTKDQVRGQDWATAPAGLDRYRYVGGTGADAPATGARWTIREGDEVYGADGGKVGKVVAVEPTYMVVEKGWFFPTDYYIPTSAIASYDGGKAYLAVTKDAALNQGWDVRPLATAEYDATATVADARLATGATRVADEETIRVPLHAEELAATTRPVERGRVRVEKDVVAEERTLEVPVTEERVRVERRAVDRPIEAGEAAFEGGVIEVPLRGEEVEVHKRARVAEEVEIAKERVGRTERVAGTVRREEVRIAEDAAGAVEPLP